MANSPLKTKPRMKRSKPDEKQKMPIQVTDDELSGDMFLADVVMCDFLIPLSTERIRDLFPAALNMDDAEKQDNPELKVVNKRKK